MRTGCFTLLYAWREVPGSTHVRLAGRGWQVSAEGQVCALPGLTLFAEQQPSLFMRIVSEPFIQKHPSLRPAAGGSRVRTSRSSRQQCFARYATRYQLSCLPEGQA